MSEPYPRLRVGFGRDWARDPMRSYRAMHFGFIWRPLSREQQVGGHRLRCVFAIEVMFGLPFIQRWRGAWSGPDAISSRRWTGLDWDGARVMPGYFRIAVWGRDG